MTLVDNFLVPDRYEIRVVLLRIFAVEAIAQNPREVGDMSYSENERPLGCEINSHDGTPRFVAEAVS